MSEDPALDRREASADLVLQLRECRSELMQIPLGGGRQEFEKNEPAEPLHGSYRHRGEPLEGIPFVGPGEPVTDRWDQHEDGPVLRKLEPTEQGRDVRIGRASPVDEEAAAHEAMKTDARPPTAARERGETLSGWRGFAGGLHQEPGDREAELGPSAEADVLPRSSFDCEVKWIESPPL